MKFIYKITIIVIAISIIGFIVELIFYAGILFERKKRMIQINPKMDLTSNDLEYDTIDIKV